MPGIQVEVLWYDDDLVSLRVKASNDRFTATTDLYEGHGVFQRVAEALEGFPRAEGDTRELELGTFDPSYAGGGAKARFRTVDAAGHAVADLSIASKDLVLGDGFVSESASFVVPVLAVAVDEFVRDMRVMDLAVGATATLTSAGC